MELLRFGRKKGDPITEENKITKSIKMNQAMDHESPYEIDAFNDTMDDFCLIGREKDSAPFNKSFFEVMQSPESYRKTPGH